MLLKLGRYSLELRSNPENPSTDLNKWLDSLDSGNTTAGSVVTQESAMRYSTVYACVRIIAETIASLPLNIYTVKGGKTLVDIDHNLSYLIEVQPNNLMTRFIFWETIISHVLLWGNGYAYIRRDSAGRPKSLELIPPNSVEPVISQDGQNLVYKIYPTGGEKEKYRTIRSENMLHIPGLSFDGVKGLSPIEYHRETIGIGLSEIDFQGNFLGKGANVSGVLENPGTLSDEAYKRIAKSWRKTYEGAINTGKTAVLEGGTTYKQIGIKPIDAQFLDQRRFTVEEIARIYRIPMHLLQSLERSTNNNIEQQSIDFVQHTIRPWIKRIEPELDRKIFTEEEKKSRTQFTRFNIDALLRGDVKSRAELYKTMFNTGAINPNQIRQMEGMNPYDGGDEYFIQMNMQTVKNAGNEKN